MEIAVAELVYGFANVSIKGADGGFISIERISKTNYRVDGMIVDDKDVGGIVHMLMENAVEIVALHIKNAGVHTKLTRRVLKDANDGSWGSWLEVQYEERRMS